jgi:hypothetical protein
MLFSYAIEGFLEWVERVLFLGLVQRPYVQPSSPGRQMGGFAKVDNVFLRLGGFAKVDNRFVYEKWLQGGQNQKGKNCAVFCFAGKKKLLFYIYAVIVKQKKKLRCRLYYC